MWELTTWTKDGKRQVQSFKDRDSFIEAFEHAKINNDVEAIAINKPKTNKNEKK